MNKIGFKNFRRFIEFEPIEYKGLTFLVGRNNSGKSTLVKAVILVNEFLKSDNISDFSFGNKNLGDSNVVTFGRAKNKVTKDDYIEMIYVVDNYHVNILISGKDDQTIADVYSLTITDQSINIKFHFEPATRNISITKGTSNSENKEIYSLSVLQNLNSEIESISTLLKNAKLNKSSKEYINLNEELKILKKKRGLIAHDTGKPKNNKLYSIDTFYAADWGVKRSIDFIIDEAFFIHDQEFAEIQKGKKPSTSFANYRGFIEDVTIIKNSFGNFIDKINYGDCIYLGANQTKQSALFPIRERNNVLAQAIHDYFQLKLQTGEPAKRFVEVWMKQFEIGENYQILLHAGEAYEVIIQSHKVNIPLADKGMGSLQAMLLILRLATIIHKHQKNGWTYTVIVEEPELNLHPALQSKLADLFHEVHIKHGIRLIVETHSEYLIRKTQLWVKEKQYEVKPNDNPFCVIYFDKDLKQWTMNYREDGKFIDEFGTGFFDETRSIVKKML